MKRKRKRDEKENERKKAKISYPRKMLRNSLEFSFVNQKDTWNKLNLKNNKYLNKSTFTRFIPFKNDLYKFNKTLEIGVSLLPGQICNIFSYEYFNNTRTFFVCPSLEAIKELILNGENYLHEYIYNLPIKFFMDIDNPIEKNFFKLERNVILKKLEKIKSIYEKKLSEICECKQIKSDWITKEASFAKKISFHIVANHTIRGIPIYFKNCEHVNSITRWIKKETRFGFIDDGIVNGKSLRMYFCSYKNNKMRLFRVNNEPMFNFDILKKSLLQLRPELVEKFYQVDLFGDDVTDVFESREEEEEEGYDEVLAKIINKRLLPRSFMPNNNNNNNFNFNFNVVQNRRKNIPKHRLQNKFNDLGKEVVDEVIRFLISKRTIRGVNFNHLSKHKNKIRIYRIMKQNETPFALYIEIKFWNCLMQDYTHTHETGRTVIVNGVDKKIGLMCGAGRKSKHDKLGFFLYFRQTSDRVQKIVLNLLKKTKDE